MTVTSETDYKAIEKWTENDWLDFWAGFYERDGDYANE